MTDKTPQLPDGIYFDLPAEIYHAQKRMSSTKISKMIQGPAYFWDDSWLNPRRKPEKQDTEARKIGRAYHDATFLPKVFVAGYYRKPEGEECEASGYLMNDTQVRAKLKDMGQPIAPKGESTVERGRRLIEAGYPGKILCVERAEIEEANEGKEGIKGEKYDQLVIDVALLNEDPVVAKHIQGGEPEVSFLFTDPSTGIPCQVRFDYLKPVQYTDLKSFENSRRKVLQDCLSQSVQYDRLYVQAVFYWQATELLRSEDFEILRGTSQRRQMLIDAIRASETPLEAWWVFQEKKGIPNVLTRKFQIFGSPHLSHGPATTSNTEPERADRLARGLTRHSAIFSRGALEIRQALEDFKACMEIYGEAEPWKPFNQEGTIGDDDFSTYFLTE